MIAHREVVGGQVIQRVLQLLRLAHREVAGIGHLVVLPLQQALPRRLRQERKRLRQHEFERRGEQRVVHPDGRRRGVLLDAENRAESRLGRQAVFDGLAAKDDPRGREHFVERCRGQWYGRQVCIHQLPEELQHTRVQVSAGLVDAETLRIVAGKGGAHRLRELLAGIERVGVLCESVLSRLGAQEPRHQIRGRAGNRPVGDRQVQLVHHQGLGGQPRLVPG